MKLLISLLLCAIPVIAGAQSRIELSLDEAIARARTRSVNAAVALDELRQAYWEYRTYRAELLPEVNFTATLPGYYKQYTSYMNDAGSYSFVRNNYLQIGRASCRERV